MPTIDELRTQFDGLSASDKFEYVTQLRNFVESNNKPEYMDFLSECENKYKADVEREQQAQAPYVKSAKEAELPEFTKPVQPSPPGQTDVDLLGAAKQQLFAKVNNSRKKVMDNSNSGKLNIAAISTVILGYVGLFMLFVQSFIEIRGSVNLGFFSGSQTYGVSLVQLIVASETTNVVAIWLVLGMLALTLCAFTKIIPYGVKITVAVFMLALLWFSPPVSESLVSQLVSVRFGPGNAYFTLSLVLVSYIVLTAIADRMQQRTERGLKNTGGIVVTVILWLIIIAVYLIPWSSL